MPHPPLTWSASIRRKRINSTQLNPPSHKSLVVLLLTHALFPSILMTLCHGCIVLTTLMNRSSNTHHTTQSKLVSSTQSLYIHKPYNTDTTNMAPPGGTVTTGGGIGAGTWER